MSSVKLHIFVCLINQYITDYCKLLFPFEREIQLISSPYQLKESRSFLSVLYVVMEHFVNIGRFTNFIIYSPEEQERNVCTLMLFIPYFSSTDENALVIFYKYAENYIQTYYKYNIYKIGCIECYLSKQVCLFDDFVMFIEHLNQKHQLEIPVQPESIRSVILGGSRKQLHDLKRTFTEYIETQLKLWHVMGHKKDYKKLFDEQIANYELMYRKLERSQPTSQTMCFLKFDLLEELLSRYKF